MAPNFKLDPRVSRVVPIRRTQEERSENYFIRGPNANFSKEGSKGLESRYSGQLNPRLCAIFGPQNVEKSVGISRRITPKMCRFLDRFNSCGASAYRFLYEESASIVRSSNRRSGQDYLFDLSPGIEDLSISSFRRTLPRFSPRILKHDIAVKRSTTLRCSRAAPIQGQGLLDESNDCQSGLSKP